MDIILYKNEKNKLKEIYSSSSCWIDIPDLLDKCKSLYKTQRDIFQEKDIKRQSAKILIEQKNYRIGVIFNKEYVLYFSSSQKESIRSGAHALNMASIYFSKIEDSEKMIQLEKRKLDGYNKMVFHNLVAINAQIIQIIYDVVPSDKFSNVKPKDWYKVIKQIITSPQDIAAGKAVNALIKIRKASEQFKVEMSIYDVLIKDFSPETHREFDITKHSIHRVLVNILYIFYPSFSSKNIQVDLKETDEEFNIDYRTFQVSIYHILDNAVKYCSSGTDLEIKVVNGTIYFSMISFTINDKDLIFTEKYRDLPPSHQDLPGSGLGMYICKKLLNMNGYNIKVDSKSNIGTYSHNIFTISPLK